MSDILVGPGESCVECGHDYGQHSRRCSVPRDTEKRPRDTEKRRQADARALGRALIEAIQNDDALLVGELLRGDKSK